MRALFWIALGLVLVAWLSRKNRKVAAASQPQSAPRAVTEQMLPCRHCGLHIPASEAIICSDGIAFCSAEHQRLSFSS